MVKYYNITFKGVDFSYGTDKGWIKDLNLNLVGGKIHAFVGVSGVGKTTLLKLIMGIITPNKGQIVIGDDQISEATKIGYVAQNYALFPWLTVKNNILLGTHISDITKTSAQDRVSSLAERFGLTSALNKFPRELSGGMKQRTAVARALCGNPSLLCFDEPFSALDVRSRAQAKAILKDVYQNEAMTILLVTHDIREAVEMSDFIHLIKDNAGSVAIETIACSDNSHLEKHVQNISNLLQA